MRLDLILTALRVPVDYLLLIAAGLSAWTLRMSETATAIRPVQFALTFPEYIRILAPTALLWIVIFGLNGLYTIDRNKKFSEELKGAIVGCFAGLAIIAIIIFVRGEKFDSRFLVLSGSLFALVYILIGRLILRAIRITLYRHHLGTRRLLMIGESEMAQTMTQVISSTPGYGYELVKQIAHLADANYKHLAAAVRKLGIEEVLFIHPGADPEEDNRILTFCDEHHLTLKFAPDTFDIYQRSTGVDTIAGIPVIELKRTRLDGWGRIYKQLIDTIGALTLFVLTLPLFLIAALAILIETGTPIIYKNERVGVNGKNFFTLKLRSMYQQYSIGDQFTHQKAALHFEQQLIAEQNSKEGPVYKIKDDPRVTRVGRFLRRWSIDEIPQFLNVIMGQMSLAGPRPHQPREVEHYAIPHRKVHTVKPGITGLAQISGRSDLPFEEENRLDMFYIENWSLLMDIAILIKTPWAVIRRRKAL